jgi:feruloyl esterase
VARQIIATAYGKAPDRSYFGGCSNGGRHAMVAAARYAADYDGFLAGDPGFNLPKAAVAQLYGAQQYASLVGRSGDLATSFNPPERQWIAQRLLARCDALDGVADGIVSDSAACQKTFSVERDLPTCTAERTGERTGQCLSAAQKGVLARVFAGATDSSGAPLYAPFPFDPGISGNDWANWKFVSSVTNRDPVAVAFVFQTPPAEPAAAADPRAFALNFPIDRARALINATEGPFTESALQFMTPPDADDLGALRARGARLLVYHGSADPVFSAADTSAWYERLQRRHGEATRGFARLFLVPGMNHCRGGPSTDQFDALSALVDWVEQGRAPDHIVARARGAGNAAPNPEVPATWAADRTRPLCAYPRVARYKGSGDIERAVNFSCQ